MIAPLKSMSFVALFSCAKSCKSDHGKNIKQKGNVETVPKRNGSLNGGQIQY